MNLPYTKIITIAVLLSGLISVPVYFASATTTINHVITGDTQKYRIFEEGTDDAALGCWYGNQSYARNF